MEGAYQTYLKIISWEDFHPHCNKRRFGKLCSIADDRLKSCTQADKDTMLRCPLWKEFRNFYNSKVFQLMKKGESDGGFNQKKAVKKRSGTDRSESSKIQRRQL